MKLPWEQLSQLGVGGTFVVIVLWMIFRFLSTRKNGTEKILLKLDASEGKMAVAVEAIATAVENQTRLVERLYDKQSEHHVEIIKEISHGGVNRRIGEMPERSQ